mmetsp:Transcript_40349/g.111147  ORF Transcript_40349/g.111147 Transcript_40349/m.111147 type:complete len:357 (-) Transcript_40349:48-1118(-)
MALHRALQHLDNADEAADAAKQKLQEQTCRLEKMAGRMDHLDGHLDEGESHIGELESTFKMAKKMCKSGIWKGADKIGGTIGTVAGATGATTLAKTVGKRVDTAAKASGAKAVARVVGKGIDSAARGVGVDAVAVKDGVCRIFPRSEPRIDLGGDPLKEGWLSKRGPMYGYAWRRRWVSLRPVGIVYYSDEKETNKKGFVRLSSTTKCYTFKSPSAPGDSLKHRGEKPFGFCVDADPDGGKERTLCYFDAEIEDEMQAWVRAICKVARRRRHVDQGRDLINGQNAVEVCPRGTEKEQTEMDIINDKLDCLKAKAMNIGGETKNQLGIVRDVHNRVDNTTQRIQEQDARLQVHIRDG